MEMRPRSVQVPGQAHMGGGLVYTLQWYTVMWYTPSVHGHPLVCRCLDGGVLPERPDPEERWMVRDPGRGPEKAGHVALRGGHRRSEEPSGQPAGGAEGRLEGVPLDPDQLAMENRLSMG